jgi:hypothetical protein
MKDKVADGIWNAILNAHSPSRELGIRSLVALQVPWPMPPLKANIELLLSQQKILSSTVQRLGQAIRRTYKGLQTSLTILVAISIAFFGILLVVSLSSRSAPSAIDGGLWRAIVGVDLLAKVIIIIFIVSIMKKLLGKYQLQFKGFAFKAFSRLKAVYSSSMDNEAMLRVALLDWELCSRSLTPWSGRVPGILISMLRHPYDSWGPVGLYCTTEASPEVVREALHVLRLPEINRDLRSQIFVWLCHVRVYSDEA